MTVEHYGSFGLSHRDIEERAEMDFLEKELRKIHKGGKVKLMPSGMAQYYRLVGSECRGSFHLGMIELAAEDARVTLVHDGVRLRQ